LIRAARAWNDGHPHEAWVILAEAGCTKREFYDWQREALNVSRRRFVARMSEASRS
jgi:hypothetical protein